jgi:hypothetical protein
MGREAGRVVVLGVTRPKQQEAREAYTAAAVVVVVRVPPI